MTYRRVSLVGLAGVLCGGVFVAASAPFAGQASPPQVTVFKSTTKIVPIYATVTDDQDRLIPDLTRADFEILDNSVRQEISVFESRSQPITSIVMLDTSGSMTDSLALVKAGAEQFLERLLPQDKAQVGAFNDKIQFSGTFTSNRDDLVAALKDIDFGYPTRLYDAIDQSVDRLVDIEGRRVIVLLTDGEDNSSKKGQGEVLDRARREEVMIYGIGLESVYFDGVRKVRTSPDRVLRRMAEETGGGYYRLPASPELSSVFTRIALELHRQYVLGFSPTTLDGKVHKLAVTVKRPGMKTRARKSYVAVGDAPAGRPRYSP
ncbi:MAG: VWA domain-containing protein [Acidobacteria bacterium]|nr:VWA domain-containing protein [Acidobacteriota bacterium]